MSLNQVSKTASPKSPPLSRSSALFSLKTSWGPQPRMSHRRWFQVLFHPLVGLECLQMSSRARTFTGRHLPRRAITWTIHLLSMDRPSLLACHAETKTCLTPNLAPWQQAPLQELMAWLAPRELIVIILETWLRLQLYDFQKLPAARELKNLKLLTVWQPTALVPSSAETITTTWRRRVSLKWQSTDNRIWVGRRSATANPNSIIEWIISHVWRIEWYMIKSIACFKLLQF